MITNRFRAILGSLVSGYMIDAFFVNENGLKDWQGIWFSFAAYSLVVALLFAVVFHYKHTPEEPVSIKH